MKRFHESFGDAIEKVSTTIVLRPPIALKWTSCSADSTDRQAFTTDKANQPELNTNGLAGSEAEEASQLIKERKDVASQLKALEEEMVVFAGVFRKPDTIHVLHRGDPEQPKEEVVPAVLTSFGIYDFLQTVPNQNAVEH